MPIRIDKGTLRSPQRLDDGRMIAEGVLTRSGVFVYRNDDGTERREFRPENEVFRADSLSSFGFVPVTDNHPSEMVTAATAKSLAVGMVGQDVRRDGNLMIAPLAINDADVIAKMDEGKVALSCGYTCDIEQTPGVTPEGERFDSIQRNIKGNHVALVDIARAGPEARVRMDKAAVQIGQEGGDQMTEELKKALQEAAQLRAELSTEKARADKAEAERDAAAARADTAEAERDTAKVAQEAAEKARTDADEGFAAKVAERVALEATAKKLAGEKREDGTVIDYSKMTDREIKTACIKLDCEGKSDEYVQAAFDLAKAAGPAPDPHKGLFKADETRADAGGDKEVEARAAMIERNREIGRKPLNKE